MRTAGNPIFIDLIILLFKTSSGVKWDISFTKVLIISESVASKKLWIECRGIKSSIAKKSFWVDQWNSGGKIQNAGIYCDTGNDVDLSVDFTVYDE